MEGLSDKKVAGVVAAALALLALNYASVWWFRYPFIYCWVAPLLKALWQPISAYGGIALTALLIVCGFLGKWHNFAIVGSFMLLFFGLPRFMEILFKLGGSCG